jgi:membrane-associated phospholipid phosphatase
MGANGTKERSELAQSNDRAEGRGGAGSQGEADAPAPDGTPGGVTPEAVRDTVTGAKDAPAEEKASLPRRLAGLARRNVVAIVAAVCVLVFLALLEDVVEGDIMRVDTLAYSSIVEGMRSDALTPVMQALSNLATPLALAVMLLLVWVFAPGRQPGLCAALNLVGAFALNQLLKNLVQRPRPDDMLVAASGYSFPSGHSMVAMAFFGLLIWMIWHYDRDRVERWVACPLLCILILGIGFSRVYLGVHYASDVIAGFCASLAWLVLYTRLAAPLLLGPPSAAPAVPKAVAGKTPPGREGSKRR